MGHFTITLPNNQQGDVRCGTIRKKTLFLDLFGSNKQPNEIKKGYIVTVEPATENRKEYRLLKNKAGEWTNEDNEGFKVIIDDETSIAIKNAIDHYENLHLGK